MPAPPLARRRAVLSEMSTTEFALTAHLVMPGGFPGDRFLADCAHTIEHRFGITHSTLQIEVGDEDDCRLEGHGDRGGRPAPAR